MPQPLMDSAGGPDLELESELELLGSRHYADLTED
jgi:hypothetical protein